MVHMCTIAKRARLQLGANLMKAAPMTTSKNRQVVLASRPEGIPEAHHFRIVEAPLPDRGPGQVLVRNEFLSVEPAMRGWVNAVANYSEPVAIGAVMRAIAAGRVVASDDPTLPVGTAVTGMFGWQEWAAVDASKVERIQETDLPLSTALGVTWQVAKLPYAVLLDGAGTVRGRGLVNTREHLESLFEARARGVDSLQSFAARRGVG